MLLDKLTNESPDEQSVLLLVLFTQCLSQKRKILLLHSTLHDINYLIICQTSNHWNFSLKITFREWHSRFQTALIGLCVGRGGLPRQHQHPAELQLPLGWKIENERRNPEEKKSHQKQSNYSHTVWLAQWKGGRSLTQLFLQDVWTALLRIK